MGMIHSSTLCASQHPQELPWSPAEKRVTPTAGPASAVSTVDLTVQLWGLRLAGAMLGTGELHTCVAKCETIVEGREQRSATMGHDSLKEVPTPGSSSAAEQAEELSCAWAASIAQAATR